MIHTIVGENSGMLVTEKIIKWTLVVQSDRSGGRGHRAKVPPPPPLYSRSTPDWNPS